MVREIDESENDSKMLKSCQVRLLHKYINEIVYLWISHNQRTRGNFKLTCIEKPSKMGFDWKSGELKMGVYDHSFLKGH